MKKIILLVLFFTIKLSAQEYQFVSVITAEAGKIEKFESCDITMKVSGDNFIFYNNKSKKPYYLKVKTHPNPKSNFLQIEATNRKPTSGYLIINDYSLTIIIANIKITYFYEEY